jgi:hypothetical protein
MAAYKVKLIYKYSDIVEVEAETRAEAIAIALNLEEINETFECLWDAEILVEV